MSHAKNFIEYIKNHNIGSFTHIDIILKTGTTTPHSVLRDMKPLLTAVGLTLREESEKNLNNNGKHTRYFIEVL
jgi:hypothetical protein